jgi:thiol-disulfide isomerase/thioredoxin
VTARSWLAGRRLNRPAAVLAALVLAAAAVWAVGVAGDGSPSRGPVVVPNPDAAPPVEEILNGVRYVEAREAPVRLLPDTIFPSDPVRLLFFEGRPAQPAGDEAALVPDGAGGIIRFDRHLRQSRPVTHLSQHDLVSAAMAADGLWLTDDEGRVLRVRTDGSVVDLNRVPFRYPFVVAGVEGVWLGRRAQRWEFELPDSAAPLFVRLDSAGRAAGTLGTVTVPSAVVLTELANAGHLAVVGDVLYYAPFIRDELLALDGRGDTLWVLSRALPQTTVEPDFGVLAGAPVIDYHPVNLGLSVGPDGRLYVLSTPGFTTLESRLDVVDPESGRLLRSARFDTPLPTLAADHDGRVYLIDRFRLLTGIAPDERPRFAPFTLDLLGGGQLTLGDLEGRVTLVNFWASWCAPCRAEMPALDTLRNSIADTTFQFITMNEDVDVGAAEAFLQEMNLQFPVALGRGTLKRRFRNVGLPFTVLLDREARVVERWIGYAGPEQIQAIRALILAELERGADVAPGQAHGAHSH